MDRRELIKRLGLLVGGSVVLPAALSARDENWSFSDQMAYGKLKLLNKSQRKMLVELAETIIPKTGTPGATDAKVGPTIELLLQDCYKPEDTAAFVAGLVALEAECKATYQAGFVKILPEKRTEILKKWEAEAIAERTRRRIAKEQGQPAIFWFTLKSLTLFCYFTSEPGQTLALNYVQTPGRWDASVKMEEGYRAFQ